jgi:hypothetical protein
MIFIPIFGLIYDILMLILVIALYRKYTMRGYLPLAILEFFVPMSRFIVIFVLRNREPIDYEAIMRARREAYIRQQQQYYNQYGNQYGSPYGNPYGNPYGAPRNNPNPAPQPPKQEDPFEEFSSDETNGRANNYSPQNGEGADDFFD